MAVVLFSQFVLEVEAVDENPSMVETLEQQGAKCIIFGLNLDFDSGAEGNPGMIDLCGHEGIKANIVLVVFSSSYGMCIRTHVSVGDNLPKICSSESQRNFDAPWKEADPGKEHTFGQTGRKLSMLYRGYEGKPGIFGALGQEGHKAAIAMLSLSVSMLFMINMVFCGLSISEILSTQRFSLFSSSDEKPDMVETVWHNGRMLTTFRPLKRTCGLGTHGKPGIHATSGQDGTRETIFLK